MNIIVPVKLVPDLVEELEINEAGNSLDTTFMRLILNEFDEHAIEQAVLLKEKYGGHVTVISPEYDGADDVLFTSAAKGVDRLMKLTGAFEDPVNSHALARIFNEVVRDLNPDLILIGVQAHDCLDGPVGPMLAAHLKMPYVGYVSGVEISGDTCNIRKEYPGGVIAEMAVKMPAVLGIQASEKPPRYIAISKVRQAMKSATLEDAPAIAFDLSGGPGVQRVYKPEVGERATMIEGDEAEVAARFVEILKEHGAL